MVCKSGLRGMEFGKIGRHGMIEGVWNLIDASNGTDAWCDVGVRLGRYTQPYEMLVLA